MKLNLQRDAAELYVHLTKRVRAFNPKRNDGPGKPGPVKMIEVGFEYSQSAWVAIVFDTRPDAGPDGEWNSHIEGNMFERPHWAEAGEAQYEGRPVSIVRMDGSEYGLTEDTELAAVIGEMIRSVLLKARQDGVFDGLPKAKGCEFGVEHQDGGYGWPAYEDRGKENLLS